MREPARLRLGPTIASVVTLALLFLPACEQGAKIREQALADSEAVMFELDRRRAARRQALRAGHGDRRRRPVAHAARGSVLLVRLRRSARRAGLSGARRSTSAATARAATPGAPRGRRTPPRSGRTWPAPSGSCGRRASAGWGSSARAWAAPPPSSTPRRAAPTIDAVVTLSAPDAIDGLTAGPDVLQAVDAAKLFIAGNVDGDAAAAAQTFYDEIGPAEACRDPDDGRPRDRPPRREPGRDRAHPHHELAPATRAGHMSRPIVFLTDYGIGRRVRRRLSRGDARGSRRTSGSWT